MPSPDKKGMEVLIGIGKPGSGRGDSDMDPKEAAGLELAEALGIPADKVDGKAVCEAAKNIMALEGYDDEEGETEEES